MNTTLLLKILFQQKRWIIATTLVAIAVATWLVISAEPVFVSGAKLWIRERTENSDLLRVQRNGPQTDTHINVQTQIIQSNRVMQDALQRGDLLNPPPSHSILAGFRPPKPGTTETNAPNKAEAPDPIKRLKALAGAVSVTIVNPEVLIIAASQNDPTIAQRTVEAVIQAYRATSLELSIEEIDRLADYLNTQRQQRLMAIDAQRDRIQNFEERHPELTANTTGSALQSPTFADQTTDVGPVPLIARQLAELELKRNRLAAELAPSALEIRNLDQEIAQGKNLLDTYLGSLAEQGKMQVHHDNLQWELEQRRHAYAAILLEIQHLDVSRGSRIAEQGGITILDPPSFDPEKTHPKKKSLLLAATILGIIGGTGLGLLAHLMDPVIRHPEAIETLTGAPLLATLPRTRRPKHPPIPSPQPIPLNNPPQPST